jgi:myo-inositol 2-dehydrogenase / D-chiro-inositol 1-dehydrogenase
VQLVRRLQRAYLHRPWSVPGLLIAITYPERYHEFNVREEWRDDRDRPLFDRRPARLVGVAQGGRSQGHRRRPLSLLRIALVGLGEIATGAHLPALLANPQAEVCAVVDVDEHRLSTVGAGLSEQVLRTTDLSDALVTADPDAVVLATPPWVTPGLVETVLAAGKYALAEKPLAVNMAATEALQALDPGQLARLQIGFTFRHDPAIERLRGLISDGCFGSPLLVRIGFFGEPADPRCNPEQHSRILRELGYAPPIVHEGAHFCDWLNLLLPGQPEEISGWGFRTDPALPAANVNGHVIRYPDGTTVLFEVAWLYPPGRQPRGFISFTGPDAHADLDPDSYELRFATHERTEVMRGNGERHARCFGIQLQRFIASVQSRTACTPGIHEALASLNYTDLLVASMDGAESLTVSPS